MKNINVSLKMIVCFVTMILLSVCICICGIIGMSSLNNEITAMYNEVIVATEYIGLIRENVQEQRVLVQELARANGRPAEEERVVSAIGQNQVEMQSYLDGYKRDILNKENAVNSEINSAENRASFLRFSELYYTYFEPQVSAMTKSAGTTNLASVETFIASKETDEMVDAMNTGHTFYADLARQNIVETDELYYTLRTIIIAATAITFIISAFFTIYMPLTIARPLRRMASVADAVAVGNMDVEVHEINRRDEVGRLNNALSRMKDEIQGQVDVVESLARADLTVRPVLRSEHDTLGKALITLTDNLDRIITDVSYASDNVADESRDVASQSQELAQGTTEQAASVEELSSAFFQISLNTKESATLAGRAAKVTDDVRNMAVEGEKMMEQMIEAIKDADAASKNIDKIIRAIEEISFQTNILSLNAAVEAAHAGQNGSGFAVVASEVRSLASKSAASSKETSELIANALEKVQLSAEIAAQTSASFKKIVKGIVESTGLVTNIAKSSEEQAVAIEQINTGITQVAQVIHINSGAAEKCASAAEKMSHQAKALEDAVSMFKTSAEGRMLAELEEDGDAPVLPPVTHEEAPIKIDLSPAIPSDDFGKY